MAIMRIDAVEVTQLGQVRLNRFESPQAEQCRIEESSQLRISLVVSGRNIGVTETST
jgi:hypothetical protein